MADNTSTGSFETDVNNSFELPYEPLTHDLIGLPSEQLRHIMARSFLMNELHVDSDLAATFQAISQKTGIYQCRLAAIEARSHFASVIGIASDRALYTKEWPQFHSKKKIGKVIEAGTQFIDRYNDFDNKMEAESAEFTSRLLDLTRDEWNLRFGWLPLDLLLMFIVKELEVIFGRSYAITYIQKDRHISEPILIPAGTPELRAIELLKSQLALLRNRSGEQRFQRPDDQIIERNVRWFYRTKIKGDTISSLAREYHQSEHPEKARCTGDRSIVQSGIKEADRLLGLTRFFIPPSPARNSL